MQADLEDTGRNVTIINYISALSIVLNGVYGGEAGAGVTKRSEQEAESCHAKIKSRQQAMSPV